MFLSVSPNPVDAEVSSPSPDYVLQYRQAFLFEVILDVLFYGVCTCYIIRATGIDAGEYVGFFLLLVLLVTFLCKWISFLFHFY
jgi:hypothetical protein